MLLALAVLGLPVPAQPPPPPPGPGPAPPPAPGATPAMPAPQGRLLTDPLVDALRSGRMLMNYENIDIRVLGRLMSELTGRNIVIDDRVQGKITVLSTREVTADEAWDIFRGALERYGFAVQQRQGFFQVVPLPEARKEGRVVVNPRLNRSEDMAMAVLILSNADATQVQNAVRPLVSDPNNVQVYAQGRALIVADKSSIVSKIAEIVRTLDRSQPKTYVSVLLPQFAEAERLAGVLQQVLARSSTNPGDPPAPKVNAFAPTNAIMVQGTAEQIQEAKRIVQGLDIPRSAPDVIERPQFYVYFLQYSQAEETAKVLSDMLGERKSQQQQQQQLNPTNTTTGSGDGGTPVLPNIAADGTQGYPRLPGDFEPGGTAGGTSNQRIAYVSAKVASDLETNSLILFVSPSEYEDIKALLAELDVPRKQVLVLAMVAEISLTRLLEHSGRLQIAGMDAGVLSTYRAGVTEEGLLSFLSSGNFVFGVAGGGTTTINVGGRDVKVPGFFAVISANKKDDDFNLLSSPRILTNDHKEAKMEVGDVVPFATGARFDNFGQPLITYDYKDVGIKLHLTPHVSQSDSIRLEVDQQIQEVTDFLRQNLGGFGYVVPLISNRSVKTTVILKEGETLMIGGLVSKRTLETINKIPILGDIPILNLLFTDKRKEEKKQTLFISLTPYIINHPDEIGRIERPYEEYLHGLHTRRDAQHEPRDTKPSRQVVQDPYQERPLGTPTDAITLHDLTVTAPDRPDSLRQARVVVDNIKDTEVELVLVGTVKAPNGRRTTLRTGALRLAPRESREVVLPPYQFPSMTGTFEFDLAAFVGDDLIARLPLPTTVEVK